MKVLLFSNDLMPFGNLPTSGGGLRCWQLKKGLEARGVEVISSMPGFTYLTEKHFNEIPEEQRGLLWQWETQDEILARTKPDAVMFASNWDHYNLSKDPSIPLVVDLHGSRLIETAMWGSRASSEKKLTVLSKADCLITAGLRQQLYFYGWLVQAGRVPEGEHFIRYIPISMSPELPKHDFLQTLESPKFVSGGGWFPWQNQANAIFAICEEIKKRNAGTIEIFGTPHEGQMLTPEEMAIRDVYGKVKAIAESSERVKVGGYIGRNDLLELYTRASVAVEAMHYNLERELAFTTRTIEYLWCGLPVIYNNFGEIAEHIREYDAGWTVDPANETEIQDVIEEIFSSPEGVKRKSENASRLVKERFSWEKTIEPLFSFLQNPVKASKVQPVLGAVYSRPSFLAPRGMGAVTTLTSGVELRQRFVCPADDIISVELPLVSLEKKPVDGTFSIIIKDSRNTILVHKKISLSKLEFQKNVTLTFPLLKRPKGGEELLLILKGDSAKSGEGMLAVRTLLASSFPLLSSNIGELVSRNAAEEIIKAECVALTFTPGYSKVYHYYVLAQRALRMIRGGQWRRFYFAIKKRIPSAESLFKKVTNL